MVQALPMQTRVVIIGGGAVGCSVAYHLAELGWRDVVLIEQGQLTCGTTWHAAGLVGQLRANRTQTDLSVYSARLYDRLEAETGQATGWKGCGSLQVARTMDRFTALKRTANSARGFGVECELITPREAGELWPLMVTDDLQGALWLPGDGAVNPVDLTRALAKGARRHGVRILEGIQVTAIRTRNNSVVGVDTTAGPVACEVLVNCAGQWAREVGALAGVDVPLHSAEHFYLVTEKIGDVTAGLPVLRDPDGYIYFKEEVGGLVMGGFEPEAKPWGMDGIPSKFEFQLLAEDWDQFQILVENAVRRVPALETAGVRQVVNGPESFTPDGNFILGEAPGLRHYYVCAGFNSAGIAGSGGAGKAMAEWIVGGEPPMDLWDVDIRRFARFHNNPRFLLERTVEALGLHYALRWPRMELASARPLRRSPLYDRLAAKGACFGSKMGWERASWFAPDGAAPDAEPTFGRPDWLAPCLAEQRATREAVAVFDQTSFSKYLLQGSDAENVLQRLCSNDLAVAPGRIVYTGMLNARGGYESDLTVARLADDAYFIVTGSAQTTRDFDWIRRHISDGERAVLTDVTSAYAVISVMGPRARGVLQRVSKADLSNDAFPFGVTREIDVGYATVRALRITYVGELGWELYVPTEFATGVYDLLCDAGREFGLKDAGYYAIDALRIEKGYRAWGAELTPDVSPVEAGLIFAVKTGKTTPFIGRDAVLRTLDRGVAKRLAQFTLDDPTVVLWGGEPILRDGEPVGEITSAGTAHASGRTVAMGFVRNPAGAVPAFDWKGFIDTGNYRILLADTRVVATAALRPTYDPGTMRPRA